MFFADDALIVPPPTPAQAERSAWIELVDSLRQDIERLKAERSTVVSPVPVDAPPVPPAVESSPRRSPASTTRATATAPKAPVRRPKPRRPIEDQWGLFDPEQCGFAALLAKLDEINARDDATA
jgi:hypothetical protein